MFALEFVPKANDRLQNYGWYSFSKALFMFSETVSCSCFSMILSWMTCMVSLVSVAVYVFSKKRDAMGISKSSAIDSTSSRDVPFLPDSICARNGAVICSLSATYT